MVYSGHVRVSGDGVIDDLEACRRALAAFAAESGGFQIVEALADIWVEESQRRAPVDTGQLRARINVTSITESGSRAEATIQSDVPYAGFNEYGTRYMPPHPYFRPGRDKAAGEVGRFGVQMQSAMARVLDSGGSWSPSGRLR
jgi:HK97 gp10 family phage protein